MKLSEFTKAYRIKNNLSQRQLGALCGLSTGYISLLEKGTNPQTGKPNIPSLAVINKLAQGMHITVDKLLAECDDMPVDLSYSLLIAESTAKPKKNKQDIRQQLHKLIDTLPDDRLERILRVVQAIEEQ